jgi:hypothetical protein
MTASIAYLARLCRRWSGELLLLPTDEYESVSRSGCWTTHPDGHHAIHVSDRLIAADRRHVNPGTVIHEMGHVFLEEGRPSTTYEPDWIGWEIALARRARCYRTWSAQNARYLLTVGDLEHVWAELAGERLRRLIAERISLAQALGIVSQDGEPLCTREP